MDRMIIRSRPASGDTLVSGESQSIKNTLHPNDELSKPLPMAQWTNAAVSAMVDVAVNPLPDAAK